MNITEYRAEVIATTACPFCHAWHGQPCKQPAPADPAMVYDRRPLDYVHDDRSLVHVDALRAALDRVRALFNGGPDTSCRTVWDEDIECVSVPIAELRDALAAVPTEPAGEQR